MAWSKNGGHLNVIRPGGSLLSLAENPSTTDTAFFKSTSVVLITDLLKLSHVCIVISLFSPFNMAVDYDKQSYWSDRFDSETSFEWLITSERFMSIIQPYISHLSSSARILQLGGGTSDLQNHFRSQGFLHVTNLDYEPKAADRGRDLERAAFGDVRMHYDVADATRLDSSHKYDLVFDKSTCDAVACGGDDSVRSMAYSVRNSLAEGGIWLSFSFSTDRFDIDDIPFDVWPIAHVSAPKLKSTDPDIYHCCFLLRPT